MVLRKVNAGFSLLSTVLLLYHAISHALFMLSKGSIVVSIDVLSWVLVGTMVLHALISIDLGISAHEGAEKRKCNSYPKLNAPTLFQRISGMALLLFTALHVLGVVGLMQPPQVVHAILPPLFFTVVLAHTAISTSKAFITLGIGNATFVKIADVVIKVICAATLIAALTGFYLFQV